MSEDFKPEIKTFLIAAFFAVVVSIGGILLLRTMQTVPQAPVAQQTPLSPVPSPQPQPQVLDTSTWQTYRSDEFGFEVKYPEEWFNITDEESNKVRTYEIYEFSNKQRYF